MALKKPCFVCGVPVRGASLCPVHLAEYNARPSRPGRPSRQDRGYDGEYDQNRIIVVNTARAYDQPCHKCGKHFGPTETITVDHVIPKRRGGTNALENLAPCCTRCNYGWRRERQSASRRPSAQR